MARTLRGTSALAERRVELDKNRVVEIAPIKATFWARVDGSLNLGFQFTQSSGVATLNVSGNATYRARKFLSDMSFNSTITTQPERDDTTRADLTYTQVYMLKKRNIAGGVGALQRNDELGINLRLLLQGIYGRYVVHTNSTRLFGATGLAVNREWNIDRPDTTNLEAVFAGSYRFFRYSSPKGRTRKMPS